MESRTSRLDFESLEVKSIVFANNSVQNCRRKSRQKLKCSLFNSLNISKYVIMAVGLRVERSAEVKGVRLQY